MKKMALPIGSVRILACRDTLAAGIATRIAGLYPVGPDQRPSVNPSDLPQGVSLAWDLEALPAMVRPIAARSLDDLHQIALREAWHCGAWDLNVSFLPPLVGPEMGLVTAWMDYSADEALRVRLVEAAEKGMLVDWLWRPMRGGPEIRLKAHKSRDTTLDADGGRDAAPPEGLPAPRWDWRGSRSWTIRLGHSADPAPRQKRPRPATPRQRACIIAMRLAKGERGFEMPSRLSIDEASAWIEQLKRAAA